MLQFLSEKEKVVENYYKTGLMYKESNMPGPAVNAFKRCIECKEEYSHKACYELAKIYTKFQDLDTAYEYCTKALMLKECYMEVIYYVVHILKLMKMPINELKKIVEDLFYTISIDYSIIAHIFYMEGLYEIALQYLNKYEEKNRISDGIRFLKIKCLIRLYDYNECIEYLNTVSQNSVYFFKTMMYKVLCYILTNKYDLIWDIFNKFDTNRLGNYNKKMLLVYMQFYNFIMNYPVVILCEEENDLDYSSHIFEVCEILLVNKEFDYFEKALNLLNLINDKSVLLQLGKLYYKYGYTELAKKEIIRSIKLFEIIDTDGLEILKI